MIESVTSCPTVAEARAEEAPSKGVAETVVQKRKQALEKELEVVHIVRRRTCGERVVDCNGPI